MNEFYNHVVTGLSQKPKKLSSRYFYDERGDKLFQKIMRLEEYYLPRCEMEIIQNQSNAIASRIFLPGKTVQVVELGAGDGSKTQYLLEHFNKVISEVQYVALDISPHILKVNKNVIQNQVPGIEVKGLAGNYFETYQSISEYSGTRLVLFLGSNIGNFQHAEAVEFFQFVADGLKSGDYFLVAFDMAKHPRKIIAAYDDSQGVTKAFNLNLLSRINKELGANFVIEKFDHYPYYNPVDGTTYSHLISLEEQEVVLKDGTTFQFVAYEAIHTEISKKFFLSELEDLGKESGLNLVNKFFDKSGGYSFGLYRKS